MLLRKRNLVGVCRGWEEATGTGQVEVLAAVGEAAVGEGRRHGVARAQLLGATQLRPGERVLCDLAGETLTNVHPLSGMLPRAFRGPPHARGGPGSSSSSSSAPPAARVTPNFFLSVPVTDAGVLAQLGRLATHLIPKYSHMMVVKGTLHVSLAMLRIEEEGQLSKAAAIVRSFSARLAAKPPGRLTFRGMDTFAPRNSVLFVKVEEEGEGEDEGQGASPDGPLTRLFIDTVRELEAAQITVLDRDRFHPHLTIAKASRAGGGRGGAAPPQVQQVDLGDVAPFLHFEFGSQPLDRLDLCSHFLPKRPQDGGYYWTL